MQVAYETDRVFDSSHDRDLRRPGVDSPPEPAVRRANPRGRPFAPGNPGRPAGSRNKATLLAESLLDSETDNLVRRALDLAMSGHPTALKLCMERIVPRRRRRAPIELCAVRTAADALVAAEQVTTLVAQGELDPWEGQAFTRMLRERHEMLQAKEFAERARRIYAEKHPDSAWFAPEPAATAPAVEPEEESPDENDDASTDVLAPAAARLDGRDVVEIPSAYLDQPDGLARAFRDLGLPPGTDVTVLENPDLPAPRVVRRIQEPHPEPVEG